MPDRKPSHEPVEHRPTTRPAHHLRATSAPEDLPVTGEQLQAQSAGALARIKPMLESVDMSIRQERATDESIDDFCAELKRINNTFLDVQERIRAGLPAS